MQHEAPKARTSSPQAARTVQATPDAARLTEDAAVANAARIEHALGNRAAIVRHGPEPAQSPAQARAAINAIVQRHPIVNGVHTAHVGKAKKHSDAEENLALKTAQETWDGIQASLQNEVLPKSSKETSALLPGVLVAHKTIKLQFDISEASENKKHIATIRQLFQKIDGRKGVVEMRVGDLAKAEDRSAASSITHAVPGLLSRIEANASSAAASVKRAAAALSPAATALELERAQRDLSVAEEQSIRIAAALLSVAKYADMVASVQVHKVAADAAMQSLRASVAAIQGIMRAAEKIADAQESLDTTRANAAQLDAAEEVVRQAEAHLLAEEELSRNFYTDLADVAKRSQFSGGASVLDLRSQREAIVEQARQTLAQARSDLQAVRNEVAAVPGEEALLNQANLDAAATKANATAAADTEIARIDVEQKLRDLAGGEDARAAFKVAFPDNAKLIGLLEAIGASRLQNWQKTPEIGAAKATAIFDALGMALLKTFVYDVGSGWCDTLIATMSVTDIVDLADDAKLGSKKLSELIKQYGFFSAAKLITGITLAKVKVLLEQFTRAELGKAKLTVEQLIDLHTKFTAVKLKHWYTIFGPESMLDFLTKYTADTLNTLITGLGEPRFEVLVRDKKLNADVLAFYSVAFLKDFVGVNDAALQHLIDVETKDDGVISGGHDPAVFTAEINRVIRAAVPPVMNGPLQMAPGQPPVRNGAILTSVPVGADCTKVTYRTNILDGSYRNGGAKTLINTLVAQQVAWKASADNAVWDAVRKKTCFVGDAGWSGTHNGITYKGFLTNNGKAVATFYPV